MQKMFIQVKGVPFSVLVLLYRVGSRNDPVSHEGITHLVEHLVSTQFEDDVAFLKKTRTLERNGILFQAITTKEYTAYICIQPKDKTHMALDYVLKNVLDDAFTSTHIKRQKKVVLQELRDEYSDIDKNLFDGACEGLWPHSTISNPIAGNVSSLKNITQKDIKKYLCEQYTYENATLLLLGEENILDTDTSRSDIKREKLEVETFEPVQPVVFKDHVTLGNRLRVGVYFKTVPAHKREDRAVLSIIADVLAGHQSSILNQSLRVDNALTYWVNQYVEYFSDTGLLGFEFSAANKDVLKALQIVQDKIDTLSGKVQRNTLLDERIDARISEIIRESHNPHVLADWYIDECLYMKDVVNLEEYAEILKNITPKKVREVVRAYLAKENRTVVLVGTPSATLRKKLTTTLR